MTCNWLESRSYRESIVCANLLTRRQRSPYSELYNPPAAVELAVSVFEDPPTTIPLMPPRAKQWFWRVTVLLALAVLGGFLWAGWYVYYRGFTRKWRAQLAAELRSRGLDFSASRLTLDPFNGLVAEKAQLYLLDERHTHLMSIGRAAVDIDFLKLIQKKPFLNSLDLRGAQLRVPVDLGDRNGPETFLLRHFQAKLIFLPGEVQITQAEGKLRGIQISLSGSLLHPESFTPGAGPPPDPQERERRQQIGG